MPILKVLFKRQEKLATADDIRTLVGPLDESIISAILHTGPTPDEVRQALQWLEENHYTGAIFSRPMDERVRHVYDILDYARTGLNGNNHTH